MHFLKFFDDKKLQLQRSILLRSNFNSTADCKEWK